MLSRDPSGDCVIPRAEVRARAQASYQNITVSSHLKAAIEEGERMKNGSFQSLFNSSEAQATRSKRRLLETIFRCCGDQRNDK